MSKRAVIFAIFAFILGSSPILLAQEGEALETRESRIEEIQEIIAVSSLPENYNLETLKRVRSGLALSQKEDAFEDKIQLLRNGAAIANEIGDSATSNQFLSQAVSLANQLNNKKLVASVYVDIGEMSEAAGRFEESASFYSKAAKIYDEIREPGLSIETSIRASQIAVQQHLEADAVVLANRALSSATALGDLHYLGLSHQNKAIVSLQLSKLHTDSIKEGILHAIAYLKNQSIGSESMSSTALESATADLNEAIEFFRESGNGIKEAETLWLKGSLELQQNNLNEALGFFQQALSKYTSNGVNENYKRLLVSLAVLRTKQEIFNEAYYSIDSATTITDDQSEMVWIQFLKANIALMEYNDSLARTTLEKCIFLAEKIHDPELLNRLYETYSSTLINLGEYDQGIAALKKSKEQAISALEAKLKKRAATQSKNTVVRYFEPVQEHGLSKQNRQLRGELYTYQNYLIVGWIVSLILGVSAIGVIFIRSSKEKKMTERVRIAEDEADKFKQLAEMLDSERKGIFKVIAQELRTPMNGIIGAIPLLSDTKMSPLQENCVSIVDVSSRSIMTLVNDVSDLSKLDSGDFKLSHRSFDLVKTVETVVQLFENDAKTTGINLICDVPSDPIPILANDPDRIQQIVLTLVGRAFQSTLKGYVRVRVESLVPTIERELNIRITVEDCCEKVSESELEDIFELKPSTTNINSVQRPASMLGMTVTKKLVDAMKGSIEVQAKEEGGSKVSVLLPFTLHPRLDHWQIPTPYQRFPRKSALFVGQNEQTEEVFSKHLRTWGLSIEHTKSIEDAQEVLSESKYGFDLIVLDSYDESSDLNTLEKISALRANENAFSTPIVLIACMNDISITHELRKQKFVHRTSKIIRIDDLHTCIRQAILFKSPLSQSFATLSPEPVEPADVNNQYAQDPNSGFHFIPYILPFRANAKINKDLKILLAEDNLVNQKVTSLMLRKIGFEIDLVVNGKEAIEAVKNGKYDVVLMDKTMPVMDGLEATVEIRKLEDIEQPIIIALTASASMEDEIACRKATMDNFLAKPVQFEKMKAALAFATNAVSNRK